MRISKLYKPNGRSKIFEAKIKGTSADLLAREVDLLLVIEHEEDEEKDQLIHFLLNEQDITLINHTAEYFKEKK
jgi:hypothetical protein